MIELGYLRLDWEGREHYLKQMEDRYKKMEETLLRECRRPVEPPPVIIPKSSKHNSPYKCHTGRCRCK